MRICFIGHSHHRSTRSHRFFLKLLETLGEVDVFFDESWRLRRAAWIEGFDSRVYDCVVIWQVREALDYLREPHPNVVFVPMYDAFGGERFAWPDALDGVKVLCFSSALHRQVAAHTARSLRLQYFPDAGRYPTAVHNGSLRGFFWQRVPAITPGLIARLCPDIVFDRFTVHYAPDPYSGGGGGIDYSVRAREHHVTFWQRDEHYYLETLSEHNVFFASRLSEGIGMSLLEAMAMGLCVVAPDTPTHNEYIVDGVTGILYDPAAPEALPFDGVHEIGARARESMVSGFARWRSVQDQLAEFIVQPVAASCAAAAR